MTTNHTEFKPTDVYKNIQRLDAYLKQKRYYFVSLWAQPKIGKSRFTMTAPKPLYLLSFEPEGPRSALENCLAEGVIKLNDTFVDEIVYNALDGQVPISWSMDDEYEIYHYFLEQVNNIIHDKNNEGGTVAIDTGTTYWDICHAVEMEGITAVRKKQEKTVMRFDWKIPNKAVKQFADSVRSAHMNIIMTHQAGPIYRSGEDTGRWQYNGNTRIPYWVDTQIKLDREVGKDEDGSYVNRWFEVESCRINQVLEGRKVYDPSWDRLIGFLQDPDNKEYLEEDG